ncbi:S-layer homology domain-containing protein [Paenibacillus pinisoli]|nr:S-layer homology domain-containing protein [Paenibacillus pinisoli]
MKKRRFFSTVAMITLLLPLIGSFAYVAKVSAAAYQVQIMTSYETYSNRIYSSHVTEYTFSHNGVVQQSSTPPAAAKWVTVSNYYDGSWTRNSWNKVFTYSNFGEIEQTTDPMSIPATAAWATISSFQVESLNINPIGNTVFRYSVNGVDTYTVSDAFHIPADAIWASLVEFTDGWHNTINHTFADYTINRTAPNVQSLTITSNSGHADYAKPGDTVTIALQSDIPIAPPVIKVAGVELTVSGSGTNWSASFDLTDDISEGTLPVSASIFSIDGTPGPVVTGATDGTTVIYDKTGPTLSHTLTPSGATTQNVAVQIQASDALSGVQLLKWAAGNQAESYFVAGGTLLTNSFMAADNGDYTVYARDVIGNVTLLPVTVSNIDRVAPSVALTASTTELTNANVIVQAAASDNVAISKQLWAEGLRTAAYFQGGEGTSFTDQFDASSNGVYSVYVEDTAGNHGLASITISNVFKQAPQLTLTLFPDTPTRDTVFVDVAASTEGEADGNALAALRWAAGEQEPAFFASGGGNDILAESEFEGMDNGKYSVYARDKAGNESVASIDITNIDRTAPRLALTPDITAPTNDYVVITVTAEDDESGISEVRWSSSAPMPDLPWFSNEVENGEFEVYSNGTYTVIATDQAGNQTLQQISIANILTAKPTLELTPDTTQPTGDTVSVTVKATALGDGNTIKKVYWAEGDLPIEYFREGQIQDITDTLVLEATENGTYTVYTRDAAGNEAIARIEISNIRSTNARLAALIIKGSGEELSLSPEFAPDQLRYTLQVASDVPSIMLKAESEEAAASVSVNGRQLAAGDSLSVLLSPGVNTIRIDVTAPLASVKRTYTIEATRERLASSGSSISTKVFSAKLNGKEWAGLDETIRSSQNGQPLFELKVDDAASLVSLVQSDKENELRIEPLGQALPEGSIAFNISSKAMLQLKGHHVKITLGIGDAAYEIPADVEVGGDGELNVSVRALRDSSETGQWLSKLENGPEGKKWQAKPVGETIDFAANGSVSKGALVLPLPAGLEVTELRKLAVFVERNGTTALLPATVRYNAGGQAIAVVIELQSSSRAVLLQAEPIALTYERYINGNADGSFAPERAVTRAELAMLLMKLSMQAGKASVGSGTNTIFADVPQSHWAAEAIAYAAGHSWMSGYPDGWFHPSKALTRAELASILVRWRELQGSGPASYPDASAHWASAAIASAEHEGWINGYADGSFRPNRSVTRAEAVAILNRVLVRPMYIAEDQAWSDVPAAHWASGAIGSASQSLQAKYYLSGEIEVIRNY